MTSVIEKATSFELDYKAMGYSVRGFDEGFTSRGVAYAGWLLKNGKPLFHAEHRGDGSMARVIWENQEVDYDTICVAYGVYRALMDGFGSGFNLKQINLLPIDSIPRWIVENPDDCLALFMSHVHDRTK